MGLGIGASGHLDTVSDDVAVVGSDNGCVRSVGRYGQDLDRIEIGGDGAGGNLEASLRVLRAERQLPGLYVPRYRKDGHSAIGKWRSVPNDIEGNLHKEHVD